MSLPSAARRISCLLGFALLGAGCSDGIPSSSDVAVMPATNDLPDSVWSVLADRSIYFGHQSVGGNILDGVSELLAQDAGASVRIVQTADSSDLAPAVLAHEFIGQNGDPVGKAEHFASLLESGVGRTADVAGMKFCYLDFMAGTDYEAAFASYQNRIESIRATYPDLVLVHFTLPLTSPQTGPKAWVKAVLGKSRRGYEDNAVRAAYNELLRAAYGGRDPVFDLSAMQSTLPDGSTFTVKVGGERVPALVPAYTDDGGHLNAYARRYVAQGFLRFLATEVETSQAGETTDQEQG